MFFLRIKEWFLIWALSLRKDKSLFCTIPLEVLEEGRMEYSDYSGGVIEKEYKKNNTIIRFRIENTVSIQVAVARISSEISIKDVCLAQSKMFSNIIMDYHEEDGYCIIFLQRGINIFNVFFIYPLIHNIFLDYFSVEDILCFDKISFLEKLFNI